MAVAASPTRLNAPVALPGLGRALVQAGMLDQQAAEAIFQRAEDQRTSFIAELTGSGALSAYELAHKVSEAFSTPLIDLDAAAPQKLPKDLLDAKVCAELGVLVLSKRGNRLMVATADPSDQTAAERIKFASGLQSACKLNAFCRGLVRRVSRGHHQAVATFA